MIQGEIDGDVPRNMTKKCSMDNRGVCNAVAPNTYTSWGSSYSWKKLICAESDVNSNFFTTCVGDGGGKETNR